MEQVRGRDMCRYSEVSDTRALRELLEKKASFSSEALSAVRRTNLETQFYFYG